MAFGENRPCPGSQGLADKGLPWGVTSTRLPALPLHPGWVDFMSAHLQGRDHSFLPCKEQDLGGPTLTPTPWPSQALPC